MDDYQEKSHREQGQNENWWEEAGNSAYRWFLVAILVLLVVAGVALGYGHHQQTMARQLAAQAATANLAEDQLQSQVNSLTTRLNEMIAAQATNSAQAAPPAVTERGQEASPKISEAAGTPAASSKPAALKHATAKRRAAPVDKRYAQLQAQLAEQQKQLKDTQEQVEKYRSDLEGNINSTREDLNGSIARTHEELVALEKRGERNYFEFDLSKSKQFQRVGPFSLSLRKADTKHKRYDLAMFVNDNQLTKKQVNLYEPISIHADNESQSAMVVVNKIDKNHVHGYISTPKYKPSELSSGSATTSGTPIATNNAAASASETNGGAHQTTQPQ